MKNNKMFDLNFISRNNFLLAGIDEAGRGPLAGPVVAAAVIFNKEVFISGVNDSKQIKEQQRNILAEQIKTHALTYGYGIVYE